MHMRAARPASLALLLASSSSGFTPPLRRSSCGLLTPLPPLRCRCLHACAAEREPPSQRLPSPSMVASLPEEPATRAWDADVSPTGSIPGDFLYYLLVKPFMDPMLRLFAPYDRGDFRWEFLTPWLDRDLTRLDKAVVCASFIWLAFVLQIFFDPEAQYTDHLSYIAFFFSYAMGNKVGYRLIAIVASSFEIYSHLVETTPTILDAIPVLYNSLFMIINLYYALRWQLARQEVAFEAVEEALYVKCFEPLGIRRFQFKQLLKSAVWHSSAEGEVVFVEGEPLNDLYVSLEGGMDVIKGGVPIARLDAYQVIGEVALLENLSNDGSATTPARATVVAEAGARYVSWPQREFYRLMQEDGEFAYAAQLMISRTLSRKLGNAREDQKVMSDYVINLASEAERVAKASRRLQNEEEAAAAEAAARRAEEEAASQEDAYRLDIGIF